LKSVGKTRPRTLPDHRNDCSLSVRDRLFHP